MRKKHRRKIGILVFGYWFLFVSLSPWRMVYSAASGNYTDLLPIGAAGNTTVISNGSGWSLTTLAPAQTFGDALSRAPMTVYQSTAVGTIGNSATISTITALNQGNVGSATFPAAWIATGRSIRITADGFYTSSGTAVNWTWDLLLGTTTILTTGALAAPINQSASRIIRAEALMTIATTGASGTVNAFYNIRAGSGTVGSATSVEYSTATQAAVACDLTTQLTIRPRFTWSVASTASSITFNNILIEFLN